MAGGGTRSVEHGARGAAGSSPPRVRFPLWARLGILFGLLTSSLLIVTGWFDRIDERESARAMNQVRMEGIATAVARLLDGDAVSTWVRGGGVREEPGFQSVLGRLRQVRDAGGLNWVGIYGRKGERTFYLMDTEDEDPVPPLFPYFDGGAPLREAFEGATRFREEVEDEWGRWDTAYTPLRASDGRVVAVVSVDIDADWRLEADRVRGRRLAGELLAASLLSVLCALLLSRALSGHLAALTRAVLAVAGGDLTQQVQPKGRDEVGVLAQAFNQMVLGLRERDTIRDAFGRYVSPEFAQRVISDPDAMQPGGKVRTITIMFADLRGFTALTESLPPGRLVALLNLYLDRMGAVVVRHGGSINEFMGDGMLALFGAWDPRSDDALRAVACAADMQIELEQLNEELAPTRVPRLEMGIGLATGPVLIGNIGSSDHAKWGVVGDAVNLAARVESYTVGGEVLLAEETLQAVEGSVTVRGPIEVRAKGRKRPLQLHALVRVEGDPLLVVPLEARSATCWRPAGVEVRFSLVEDKHVQAESRTGVLVDLAEDEARLHTDTPIAVYDNLRLLVPGTGLADLYAKVVAREEEVAILRFTSSPGQGTVEAQIRAAAGLAPADGGE